ncbi:MAG TPA: 2Fe-2S iron-sulfur cluster binding domain-containing protein [Gammaproteobacteria bacterium]|nr:2Fe-2S iron-sulfur cluster binding domain-containing protein [Gammaproteobacteria bacterium]
MTTMVRLEPSGHQFEVETGETILEAGLRAGLPIQYHCSNGTCGECKGIIIQGIALPALHHDYVIKSAEKQAGTVLLCRTTTNQDLVIQANEARSAEDIPQQNIMTRVSKIDVIHDHTLILNLRTPRSHTLRFLAGQHAQLEIKNHLSRIKTIASCPCNGMILQFHFTHNAGDPFTDYIFNKLHTRESVYVSGPFGKVSLEEDDDHPIIFIVYKTGFSMVKSLVELAISWDKAQTMHLFWITDNEAELYYENYCRSWAAVLDDFQYTPFLLNGANKRTDVILMDSLENICDLYPDISRYRVFLNIPRRVEKKGKSMLLGRGVEENLLHMDDIFEYR